MFKKTLLAVGVSLAFSLSGMGQSQIPEFADFDSTSQGYASAEKLAEAFLQHFILGGKASEIEKYALSLKATHYLMLHGFEKRGQVYPDSVKKKVDGTFNEELKNFVAEFESTRKMFQSQNLDFSNANISNLQVSEGDWYQMAPQVLFAQAQCEVKVDGQNLKIQLRQMVRLRGRWFILNPEITWQ